MASAVSFAASGGTGTPHLDEAYDSLSSSTPLDALKAHSTLLAAPLDRLDRGRLQAVMASGDRLARGLVIGPLARVEGRPFDDELVDAVSGDDPFLREQALAALAGRSASARSIESVLTAVADGGHAAVVAQLTFERWVMCNGALAAAAIPMALDHRRDDHARARLIETATVGDDDAVPGFLLTLLRSSVENDVVRAAAARGLAARPLAAALDDLYRVGLGGGPELRFACARALLAVRTARSRDAAAALATAAIGSCEPFDRLLPALVRGRTFPRPVSSGMRVAQIFLQGRLDAELAHAGAGDDGGIATLLVHLGHALGARPAIASVTTVGRALAEPETGWRHARLSEVGPAGVAIERVPFGPAGYLRPAAMWEHRLELERALETAFAELGGFDIAHLRFADAGAFAAARVCRRLGIPVVFTAAPDPHGVIAAREQSGELTRSSFPEAELDEHYLLRTHLVEDLLHRSDGVVVLPRPRATSDFHRLIGAPFAAAENRSLHTVPEGISLAAIDRAIAEPVTPTPDGSPPSLNDVLLGRVAALPRHRHGLPLLVSVGRLNRVKGLPLLLEAWVEDDDLYDSLNLVIVGGRLEQPTEEEQLVLRSVEGVCTTNPRARDGLILLGHRPNHEVATLLRTAKAGLGALVASNGVYACTSQKEEFGVALLEAMASGLAVVAPSAGGPATYVTEGVTGFLADTSSIGSVTGALRRATGARADEARAERASTLVRTQYTIEAMAESLEVVYRDVVRAPLQVAA